MSPSAPSPKGRGLRSRLPPLYLFILVTVARAGSGFQLPGAELAYRNKEPQMASWVQGSQPTAPEHTGLPLGPNIHLGQLQPPCPASPSPGKGGTILQQMPYVLGNLLLPELPPLLDPLSQKTLGYSAQSFLAYGLSVSSGSLCIYPVILIEHFLDQALHRCWGSRNQKTQSQLPKRTN